MIAIHALHLSSVISVSWILWQFTLMILKPQSPMQGIWGECSSLAHISSYFSSLDTWQFSSLPLPHSNDPVFHKLFTFIQIVFMFGTVTTWNLHHNLLLTFLAEPLFFIGIIHECLFQHMSYIWNFDAGNNKSEWKTTYCIGQVQ